LAKAMGLRAGKTPKIVDATAGLGRDSFLLASLGAEVTMIERSDVMHGLLQEGMAQGAAGGGYLWRDSFADDAPAWGCENCVAKVGG
jgi:16S rRNA (guanine1516-N2)-methyltransferase